ncbi:hypothetical protein E4U52_001347 [Claviceps spartinae]|nr:hypothetical protein E4U52_001347 [Claviceps spartinae]
MSTTARSSVVLCDLSTMMAYAELALQCVLTLPTKDGIDNRTVWLVIKVCQAGVTIESKRLGSGGSNLNPTCDLVGALPATLCSIKRVSTCCCTRCTQAANRIIKDIKDNAVTLTVQEFRDTINSDGTESKALINRIICFSSCTTDTRAYWTAKRRQLDAMVRTLGKRVEGAMDPVDWAEVDRSTSASSPNTSSESEPHWGSPEDLCASYAR